MSYTVIHRDTVTGDDGYGQNSLQSEATAQPYSPEQERANAPPPPHCMRAVVPPVHCASLAQWNAPTLHSSVQAVQDQRYGAPLSYANNVACNTMFGLTRSRLLQPKPDLDTGNVMNGSTAYYQDNRISAGRDLMAGPLTCVFAPDGEAPAPSSESLRVLTRRYVLDPGTRIETVHMGPKDTAVDGV
ncbi:hypothetical protein BJV77DRAFT_1001830 [Russula vinacea]|nr:hypothetical protein BJV77DRAFT_1001830 [Russula vinacea]